MWVEEHAIQTLQDQKDVLGKVVGEQNIPGRDWEVQMPKIEKGFVPFKK